MAVYSLSPALNDCGLARRVSYLEGEPNVSRRPTAAAFHHIFITGACTTEKIGSVTAAVGKVTALGYMSCCGPVQEWQFKELCEGRSLRAFHRALFLESQRKWT
ncbi:hypothetical protein ROHU_019614 [Labeo rohita]|uniref:Uncharacterized protein n=1 Tax=Labeo rohita TaxID=84645 RepID=A0A498N1E4_LABRO|nr:hypothetical protein ROHU_019614 [Labeo rohita]